MKWIALGFLFVGLLAIITAAAMNKTSSFEDGSFLGEDHTLYLVIAGLCPVYLIWIWSWDWYGDLSKSDETK